MKDTKIRWANDTWNPFFGCTKVSPGCDNCYAEALTIRFGLGGFEPRVKEHKFRDAAKTKIPSRIFVNSMSDVHHAAFKQADVDRLYDAMCETTRHDYLLLTKRPQRMAKYLIGDNGYLARRGLAEVPENIWLGTSIENDTYSFRADWLRQIPVPVRFISAEPLLGPLPSLNLDGIGWVIVGGESGPNYRMMDHRWARDIRDRCNDGEIAFYFKQSSAPRTEMGITLDGLTHEEYPYEHPSLGIRKLGRWVDGNVLA